MVSLVAFADANPNTVRGSDEILYSLQYLLAFAAVAVVLHHAREQLPNLKAFFPAVYAQSGVDLLFIVCGFILMVTTSNEPGRSA